MSTSTPQLDLTAARIIQLIDRGTIELPALPDLVMRLRRELTLGKANARVISDWMRADPAIAGVILRSANSAMYGGVRPITDLSQAIARLGLKTVHSLVVTITLKGQFQSTNPMNHALLRKLWNQSMTNAAAARTLAERLGQAADDAFLAGLLAGTGRLVVLRAIDHLSQKQGATWEIEDLIETMELLQGTIGETILRKWGMPEDIVNCAVALETAPSSEDSQLVVIIRGADCFARRLGNHISPDPGLKLTEQDSIDRLGLTDIEIGAMLEEVRVVVGTLCGMI